MAAPRVRFEDVCVLIPCPETIPPSSSALPRIITRTYSLPLTWRKKPSSSAVSDSELDAPSKSPSLTVRMPSFQVARKTKPRRTLSSDRECSRPPCLRREGSSGLSEDDPLASPPASPVTTAPPSSFRPQLAPLTRSPHQVPSVEHVHHTVEGPQPTVETVPLRPCCSACLDSVEESLANPTWCERFSKGAIRRRRASESEGFTGSSVPGSSHASRFNSAAVAPGFRSTLLVKVDEVEVCRDKQEKERAKTGRYPWSMEPPPNAKICSLGDPDTDEEELFPLPSPRRSPVSGTPPLTESPNASTSCVSAAPAASSDDLRTSVHKALCPKARVPSTQSTEPPVRRPSRSTPPPLPSAVLTSADELPLDSPLRLRQSRPTDIPSAQSRSRTPSQSPVRRRRSSSFLKSGAAMIKGISLASPGGSISVGSPH